MAAGGRSYDDFGRWDSRGGEDGLVIVGRRTRGKYVLRSRRAPVDKDDCLRTATSSCNGWGHSTLHQQQAPGYFHTMPPYLVERLGVESRSAAYLS